MKPKFLLTLALVVVLGTSPAVGYAAWNDVTLSSDTVISTTSETLNLTGAGGALQSISVEGDVITVAMTGNSYLKLTSTGRRILSAPNRGSVTQTGSCTDSLATDMFEAPSAVGSVFTFDITVTSSTCTTGTSNNSGGNTTVGSSGGGGGGGSSYTYIPPAPEPTPIVTATAPAQTASAASLGSVGSITRVLAKGATNAEVTTLQKILNSDPDTRIAVAGTGSPGNETDFFGPATLKAVQKFQVKYGIAKPGDSGYGNVGPLTRTILNSLSGKTAQSAAPATATAPAVSAPSAPAPAPAPSSMSAVGTVTRVLSQGTTNTQVKTLQRILNSDPDTMIAATGVGSPGNETTYFGPATLKAVQKFQVKYGIAKPGDSGYGNVGPLTRSVLNGFAAKAGNPDQQIEDAMKQIKILQDQLKAQ